MDPYKKKTSHVHARFKTVHGCAGTAFYLQPPPKCKHDAFLYLICAAEA